MALYGRSDLAAEPPPAHCEIGLVRAVADDKQVLASAPRLLGFRRAVVGHDDSVWIARLRRLREKPEIPRVGKSCERDAQRRLHRFRNVRHADALSRENAHRPPRLCANRLFAGDKRRTVWRGETPSQRAAADFKVFVVMRKHDVERNLLACGIHPVRRFAHSNSERAIDKPVVVRLAPAVRRTVVVDEEA